jgi:hypothetical protein
LLCLLFPLLADAGVPVVTNQLVTDVTTRSFSVILTTNEPSTAVLSLFGADCTTPASGFATALQQNTTSGNMRVTVSNLNSASGYCYQVAVTSTSTADVTTSAPVLVSTATAIIRSATSGSNIVPTGNDILKVPAIFLATGETRDAVVATVELVNGTALAPLSLLLSTSASSDYFNLNNLFTSAGSTLSMTGAERVKISENHGVGGCVVSRFRTLPTASGGTAPQAFVQANANDIDASGGVNILDILRVVAGKATTNTGSCFNSDLDLNGDGVIDSADVAIIKGGFNGLP